MQNFVHVGAVLLLVCFLCRDQLMLRAIAVAADLAYVVYFFNAADQPLWVAIFWKIPTLLINLSVITLILRDSRTNSFTDNELRLYRSLNEIRPRDFRKLLNVGTWHRVTSTTQLSRQGQPLGSLYYVLEGGIDIEKNNRKFVVKPGLFIGEIAYLKQSPATATVHVMPGTLYMSWSHAALAQTQAKHDGLKNAIGAILNSDLAGKLART